MADKPEGPEIVGYIQEHDGMVHNDLNPPRFTYRDELCSEPWNSSPLVRKSTFDALAAKHKELTAEHGHTMDLVIKLGGQLGRIVNTIRGEPEAGTLHSTHDAAELVEGLRDDLNQQLKRVRELEAECEQWKRAAYLQEQRAQGLEERNDGLESKVRELQTKRWQYTASMGQAADDYLQSVGRYAHPLPGQFRWSDCYRAMLAAAPKAQDPAPAAVEKDRPLLLVDLENGPPLLGRWRHSNGYLCNGSLRIFTVSIDTNPSAEFEMELLDWVCETLNKAQAQEPRALPKGKYRGPHLTGPQSLGDDNEDGS